MAETVTRYDAQGRPVEVEVGQDGVNPVSVDNPPARARDDRDYRTGFGQASAVEE